MTPLPGGAARRRHDTSSPTGEPMTDRLLRGRILTFHREPEGEGDGAHTTIEDGAILMRGGL